MGCGDPKPLELSYSKDHKTVAVRISGWLEKLPPWLIALGLTAPVWMFQYYGLGRAFTWQSGRLAEHVTSFLFYATLFIPNALRRLNWRHVLAMLALAGLRCGVDAAIAGGPVGLPYPYFFIVWPAISIAIAGFGEWLLASPRPWRSLLWVMAFAAAAGCVLALIQRPLDFTGIAVSIPGGSGSRYALGDIIYWPTLVVLTWIAIPTGLELGRHASNGYERRIAAGLAMASAAAFLLFFHIVVYQLAHRSLVLGGPFGRGSSVSILETRGNLSDQQALWDALETADWSKSAYEEWPDYRKICVDVLVRQDRGAAARRLSKMLRDRPSQALANFAARVLADERRYEAAPLLTRFALLRDSECTEALEAMKVPCAAIAIVWGISPYELPMSPTADFPIGQARRERLAQILGRDAGPNLSDWTSYYEAVADRMPTPLSEKLAAETNRVTQAMVSYWAAAERLAKAEYRLAALRLKADGIDKQGGEWAAIELQEGYIPKAFTDMAVPPPDWGVRDVASLEKEIADYSARVDTMIAKFDTQAVAPSTSPSSSR